MKALKSLVLPFIIPLQIIFAQTGPGGVGSTDGSSALKLWLDANIGIYSDMGITQASDGANVQLWQDQSGNVFNAVQDSISARPEFSASGGPNGSATLIFSSSAISEEIDFLDLSDHVSNIINKTQCIYVVSNGSEANFDFLLHISSSSGIVSNSRFDGLGNSTTSLEYHLGFTNLGASQLFMQDGNNTNNTSIIGAVSSSSNIIYNKWDEGNEIFISTNNDLGVNDLSPNGDNVAASNFFIGRHASSISNLNRCFDGDITEIIVFDETVNQAQNIIIHNYLAAKYGLTLAANDVYNQDIIGSGNYDYDVAGIGRINSSNIHNDAQGTGILRILNPTDLENNEFLMWGHDNGVQQAIETSDVPAGIQARFDRVWRVSERNTDNNASVNVGNIDMRWNLNSLGSITASDLRLLIDDDNDGIFSDETPISGAIDLGGGIFEFQNITGGAGGIRNDRRFTLATINISQTPLPIELIYFDAKPEKVRSVKIVWQTASEMNNDYFTVERSINGLDWEIVSTVLNAINWTRYLI